MEKAILILASHDYPLWTLDEESGSRLPGLPAYLPMPEGLEDLLDGMQKEYDSYFGEKDGAIFFRGFATEAEREHPETCALKAERILREALGSTLEVENRIPGILMLAPVQGQAKPSAVKAAAGRGGDCE